MQKSRVWMFFVALAGLCWGVYVPLIAEGGRTCTTPSSPSYASAPPTSCSRSWCRLSSCGRAARRPAWNGRGVTFSTLAGVAGAVGALCVVFATVVFHGPPMLRRPGHLRPGARHQHHRQPLLAPRRGAVHRSACRASRSTGRSTSASSWPASAPASCCTPRTCPTSSPARRSTVNDYTFVIFVLLAGLSWGVYVPLIAQGGKELKSSYASFLCVGAAYFVIAVLLPLVMLWYMSTQPPHAPPPGMPPLDYPTGITLATLAARPAPSAPCASSSPPSSSKGRASTSPR